MASAKHVAEWMASILEDNDYIFHEFLVPDIRKRFGESFLYKNHIGNYAIKKSVLEEFRKLTEGRVVWERSTKNWRKLRPDEPYYGRSG